MSTCAFRPRRQPHRGTDTFKAHPTNGDRLASDGFRWRPRHPSPNRAMTATPTPIESSGIPTSLTRVDWVSDLIRLEIVLWERVDARLRERHELPLSFFESLYFVSRAPERSLRVGDLAHA